MCKGCCLVLIIGIRRQLSYWFSETVSLCKANWPQWNQIYDLLCVNYLMFKPTSLTGPILIYNTSSFHIFTMKGNFSLFWRRVSQNL